MSTPIDDDFDPRIRYAPPWVRDPDAQAPSGRLPENGPDDRRRDPRLDAEAGPVRAPDPAPAVLSFTAAPSMAPTAIERDAPVRRGASGRAGDGASRERPARSTRDPQRSVPEPPRTGSRVSARGATRAATPSASRRMRPVLMSVAAAAVTAAAVSALLTGPAVPPPGAERAAAPGQPVAKTDRSRLGDPRDGADPARPDEPVRAAEPARPAEPVRSAAPERRQGDEAVVQAAVGSVAAVLPAPTAPPAPVAPAVAVPSRPAAPSLVLPPGEMLVLIKRGQDAIEAGDIAGARLLLTRAAEAGNAHAALLLGTTYDPAALRERKVLGLAGDPQQARFWYERAADLGSTDAGRRLDDLARGR